MDGLRIRPFPGVYRMLFVASCSPSHVLVGLLLCPEAAVTLFITATVSFAAVDYFVFGRWQKVGRKAAPAADEKEVSGE